MKNFSKHYQKRIAELKAENASLKAEVERLRASSFVTAVPVEEYEKLKAEVERLRHLANQSEFYRTQLQKDTCRLENIQMQDAFKHYETENASLKAEVERLRKAGDWMFNAIILNSDKDIQQGMNAWNAARDGKPTE